MHIFFSGIGGTGIGPLALIARQAGYTVSGSDKQDSQYIKYLRDKDITNVYIGQTEKAIAAAHAKNPIDWYVYSSAVGREDAEHPELKFVEAEGIRKSKRDELLNQILKDKKLKLFAVAGTHGKTTTTAMAIWLFKQLKVPVSYSVGAKISFGDMGHYEPGSEYFIYEADEFDRNFLTFHPHLSIITGIGWDHPDIFPTEEEYYAAFRQFLDQSEYAFIWNDDAATLGLTESTAKMSIIHKSDYVNFTQIGAVNREDAALATQGVMDILQKEDITELTDLMNTFPGVSRRFEEIAKNVYSDYAHTPEKIRGALQLAREVAGQNVVVVYEGLHNTRQHFIKDDLGRLFEGTKKLYIVPSYRAREDESLEDLTPSKLAELINTPKDIEPSKLDDTLKHKLAQHAQAGDLVLCLSAGGGGSLDEWIRQGFSQ